MTQLQQQLKTVAHWRGSAKTADAVREEIARRWGDKEAAQYDPLTNCFTIRTWNALGYRVKKGEKAIRSMTYVEATDGCITRFLRVLSSQLQTVSGGSL